MEKELKRAALTLGATRMHTPRSRAWPQSYSCHERWVMAYNDHMWFIGTFCFAAGFLLVFSLVTAGVATAQNPVALINPPLVPDAAEPGGAAFTLTVNGSGFVSV